MSEPADPTRTSATSFDPNPFRQPTSSRIPWAVCVVSVVGLVAVALNAQKSSKRAEGLDRELNAAKAKYTLVSDKQRVAESRVQELEGEKLRLSGALQETVAQKEAAQAELDRTRTELSTKLANEIKEGEVVLRLRGGDLIVDVSDKVLFDTGKAEVSERGQQVLRQVAASIIGMPKRVFQVSGHTDAARVKSADVRERFPTNWELSTARATNVVRFLQEKCGIPGKRLVAAGYGEHQPIASNATEKGKQRNRRIEMALLKEVPAE
jgi:chemotaxis protein MotB